VPEQDEDEREIVQMNKMQTGLHSEAFQKFKSFSTRNIIVYVLIALIIGFALGNNAFLQVANLVNLTTQMAINAMLSAGLTYVIIWAVSISRLVQLVPCPGLSPLW